MLDQHFISTSPIVYGLAVVIAGGRVLSYTLEAYIIILLITGAHKSVSLEGSSSCLVPTAVISSHQGNKTSLRLPLRGRVAGNKTLLHQGH